MNCEEFKKTTIIFLRKQNIPNDLSQLIITFLECKETDCHSIDIYALGAYYLTSRNLREVNWNYIKKDKDFDDYKYHEDDCYCMEHIEYIKDMMLFLDRALGFDNEREEDSYDLSYADYSDDGEPDFLGWDFNASCDI